MGKRKTPAAEEELLDAESPSSVHRKHKKHKKKHKKRRDVDCEADTLPECSSHDDISPTKPSIKLKIKIGGHTLSTQSITSPVSIANAPVISIKAENPNKDEEVDIDDSGLQSTPPGSTDKEDAVLNVLSLSTEKSIKVETHCQVIKNEAGDDTFVTKKKSEDTSDEEQQWLDALEAGTLDDNGEIKKEKDPSLLTARQRALIHGTREDLQQLPSGYKTPELTEEQLQRRQQRAHKRRQQAQEKREKDKKQTLERLLKKQEAKSKAASKTRSKKHHGAPMYRYVQRVDSSTIHVPPGFSFPFQTKEKVSPPKQRQMCGIKGCNNPKKYSCSKTQLPLCSLACYKKNQLLQQLSAASAR